MWALLNPAFMMLVMTLVFSSIMRFNIPHYAIFLLSVLLALDFFFAVAFLCGRGHRSNGDLIKKVAVPKLVFPMAAVVSNIINLLFRLSRSHCWCRLCATRSTGPGSTCLFPAGAGDFHHQV